MNENAQKFFFYLLGMAIGLMMPGPVSKSLQNIMLLLNSAR